MRQQAVQERQQLEARERHEVLVERLERLRADTTNVLESLGLSEGAANLVHTVQGLVEAKEELDLRVEKLEEEGEVRGDEIGKLQRRAVAWALEGFSEHVGAVLRLLGPVSGLDRA